MDAYRGSPELPPLVMSMSGFVVSLDPESGRLRWKVALEGVHGLYAARDRLLVCARRHVHVLDRETGDAIAVTDIGFATERGICDGERLVVADGSHAACVTREGVILWRVFTEGDVGLVTTSFRLVLVDGNHDMKWATPYVTHRGSPPAFVLGDEVVQPHRG